MQASHPTKSPIINANPIIGENPIISPIINAEEVSEDYDISCGCSASVPPGSRILFMKMAVISMLVASLFLYGFFQLAEYLNWM